MQLKYFSTRRQLGVDLGLTSLCVALVSMVSVCLLASVPANLDGMEHFVMSVSTVASLYIPASSLIQKKPVLMSRELKSSRQECNQYHTMQ